MNYRTAFALSTAFLFIAFVATAHDDTDGDGVLDVDDNCILVANAGPNPNKPEQGQKDSDDDGFGNICDADLNNDCVVGVPDFLEILSWPLYWPDCRIRMLSPA